MRKWHRWLVVFSAIFMVWIAGTGLVGQVISLGSVLSGEGDHDGPPPWAKKPEKGDAAGSKIIAPAGAANQRPPEEPGPDGHDGPPRDLYHFIIDLHSGNYFGPVGKIISALMGATLLFLAGSGAWMYLEMFRRRRRAGKNGLFWD